jgi:O-antigen ligase
MRWVPHPRYLIPAAIGGVGIGALVAIDPYVRGRVEFTLKGRNLLDLFPYELPVFILGAVIVLVLAAQVSDRRIDPLILFLLFLPPHFKGLTPLTGPLVTALALAVLLMRKFYYHDLSWNPTPTFVLALATVPFNFLAMSLARYVLGWFQEAITEVLHVILFFIIVNVVITRVQLKRVLRYVVGVGVFSALVSIASFFLFVFTGISISLAPDVARLGTSAWGVVVRSTAFCSTPNGLAGLLEVPAVIVPFLAISPLSLTRRQRLLLLGIAAVLFLGDWATVSRGSWLGIAAAFALYPFFRKPSWWPLFLGIFVMGVSMGLVTGILQSTVSSVVEELVEIRAGAVTSRMHLLWKGVEVIKRYPWTGVGLGNFPKYTPELLPVHNLEVQMASEVGIPGALIHGALMLLVTVRAFLAMLGARDAEGRTIMQMVLLALVTTFIHGQFDTWAFTYHIWLVLGMAEAATLCVKRRDALRAQPIFAP